MTQLSNYLFFTTTCEEALAFYTKCGLGRVVEVMRHGESGGPLENEAMRGKVMHAKFEGPGVLFYASDNDDAEPMRGSAHILMLEDRGLTARLFGDLGEGGVVTTPLGMQPWGDFYGKLTDRFGVQWMLNCSTQPVPSVSGVKRVGYCVKSAEIGTGCRIVDAGHEELALVCREHEAGVMRARRFHLRQQLAVRAQDGDTAAAIKADKQIAAPIGSDAIGYISPFGAAREDIAKSGEHVARSQRPACFHRISQHTTGAALADIELPAIG